MLLLALVFVANNPLRRSDRVIRERLIRQMPLNSSSEQVRAFAKARGWFDPFRQRADAACYGPYIRGELGRYWSGLNRIYVSAIWEFDGSNRLAHVRVWKKMEHP